MNPDDSAERMAERTRDQFIYSEKWEANSTAEIDIERVNIRPREFLFFFLLNSSYFSNPIWKKKFYNKENEK